MSDADARIAALEREAQELEEQLGGGAKAAQLLAAEKRLAELRAVKANTITLEDLKRMTPQEINALSPDVVERVLTGGAS